MSKIQDAISSHDIRAVNLALQAEAGQLDSRNELGETPLHRAIRENLPEVVRLLLAAGADAHIDGPYGDTPLHYAAYEDNTREIAELLIDYGADINRQNESGETPLHIAAMRGNKEIAGVLLQHGAQVDLDAAVLLGDANRVRELLRQGPYLRASKPDLLLDVAVRRGQKALVELLLKHGLDPNAGRPPILTAIEMSMNDPAFDLDIVQLLIDHGVDIRQPLVQSGILTIMDRFQNAPESRVAQLLSRYGLKK